MSEGGVVDVTWVELGKLLLAVALGGILGAEREFHDRPTGLRTTVLISLGACLFTIYSPVLGGEGDPVRITAAIVSGIGFLGAGVILREGGRISGLTTAATVWIAAAVGMGVGGGFYLLSVAGTLLSLAVLGGLFVVETRIDLAREVREYVVTVPYRAETIDKLTALFEECGLRVQRHGESKDADGVVCHWRARGSTKGHDLLVRRLFDDPDVRAFEY
jgi:putative Mg2+ transporter-C (MgtC) family protein